MLTAIRLFFSLLAVGIFAGSVGCLPPATPSPAPNAVTLDIYTSVDEPYAKAVVAAFEAHEKEAFERGEISAPVVVALKTDSELEKTVGLANLLLSQKAAPRADVWWGNEPSQTIRLQGEGMFEPYESPNAAARSGEFRDPQNRWTMLALRLRVLVRKSDGPEWPADVPKSFANLPAALEKIKSHTPEGGTVLAMANPRWGTTNTHAAAMFQVWGEEKSKAWYTALRDLGCVPNGGNMQVVKTVARGAAVWGLTDTDDVFAAKAENQPVEMIVLPETLAIPNTVAIIKNANDPAAAKRFVDFLLSPKGETIMANVVAKHLPVRADVPPPPEFPPVSEVRPLPVRWAEVDPHREAANAFLESLWPAE